ncbi:uncharacterized protein [Argopecten irradians]|uniref:uncharacterized protein n=1 Tax=Argopecten irradians TaxID=31199 RepID=UPI00371F47CC
MASREYLKKINKTTLQQMCSSKGFDFKKKTKDALVDFLFTSGVSEKNITPVVDQNTSLTGLHPRLDGRPTLPPFHRCAYHSMPYLELPSPSFEAIYTFMISRSRASCPDRGVQNFKGMDKAVRHFEAGDVQDIQVSKISDDIMYIKGSCLASMKKDKYTVYLCLTTSPNEGPVLQYAFCQCPIGLAQSCSHIGGLLFALNGKHRLTQEGSCTSKLCKWVVPRKINQDPRPVSDMTFSRPQHDKESSERATSLKFDPRHPGDRDIDGQYISNQLQELRKIFPSTGLTHLWNIPDDVPEFTEEVSISCEADPCQKEMESLVITPGTVFSLTIDDEVVKFIEQSTRGQRSCQMWIDLHKGRITSSIFGKVLKAGNNPNSLIKQIIEGSDLSKYHSPPAAVKWGQDHESSARREYVTLRSILGDEVDVRDTGLTLCKTHSFLGASSDGMILEQGDEGILEIKCPYSLKGQPINLMEVQDIVNLNDPSFCLTQGSNGPELRKDHEYYAQVQGEMGIIGLPWCDFVVWTGAECNNIFVERVQFDVEFTTTMMPKLVAFYVEKIVPKLHL